MVESKGATVGVTLLRVLFGGLFLESGVTKLLTPGWTASGFLSQAKGPFAGLFTSLAGSQTVDILVTYGEILIGAAIVLGLLVRIASYSGIVMMLLYYLTQLPPQRGWLTPNLIYLAVFLVLALSKTGYYWGLDRLLPKDLRKRWAPVLG